MTQTADYTIQGFLYQFNVTIQQILQAQSDAIIVVEGIIEDVEIVTESTTIAVQCKYHESKDTFALSVLYKPLLQMMEHFQKNPSAQISYKLFAHFPSIAEEYSISKDDLTEVLDSSAVALEKYTSQLRGRIDLDKFLERFSFIHGPSYDELMQELKCSFQNERISSDDFDLLIYPNALNTIANLSIHHDVNKRQITRHKFLGDLKNIESTAISRWTMALFTKKQLLESRRKQLKVNLGKNARSRHFLFFSKSFVDFNENIVTFIVDYVQKYHCKQAHICTPLFALDTDQKNFDNIVIRLHAKGIIANTGIIAGSVFDKTKFFKKPLIQKIENTLTREFHILLLRVDKDLSVLNVKKSDDLFILGTGEHSSISTEDLTVEKLSTDSFAELKFVMGLSNDIA
jgi:hypothetical protein